jgi:glycosyltransferase involved in cell wall biosynthesis
MKLSVIVSTRNRAAKIRPCLDSIATALAKAALPDAEIVVVNNGSTDNTSEIVKAWAFACPFPVCLAYEPRRGISYARNQSLKSARGELLAFTDDDCRLSADYITDLLRHDAADTEPILRGGRVELGDQTDLPITIKNTSTRQRFNRHTNPATTDCIVGQISGCNMAMRRAVADLIGPFDERLGAGAIIPSAEDSDYHFRAYLAGITLEYVPDMVVSHHHGRKHKAVGYKLYRDYTLGTGALYAKYFFTQAGLCRPFLWDLNKSLQEILTGTNLFLPAIGFSFKHKVAYSILGAVKYCFIPGTMKKGQ